MKTKWLALSVCFASIVWATFLSCDPEISWAQQCAMSPSGDMQSTVHSSLDASFYESPSQAAINFRTSATTVTFPPAPGAASQTALGLIPDGATVIGFSSRVVTTGTNCASIDIGFAGFAVGAFATAAGIVDGNTTDNTDVTSTWSFLNINPATVATNVDVTANGGNCFDLVIDLHVNYIDTTAAIADL